MSVKIRMVIFKRGGIPTNKISEVFSSTLTRQKTESPLLGFELGPLASDVFNLTRKPLVAFKGEEKGKTDKTEHCSTCRRAYSSRSSTMTTQCLEHWAGFDPGRIGHL